MMGPIESVFLKKRVILDEEKRFAGEAVIFRRLLAIFDRRCCNAISCVHVRLCAPPAGRIQS